MEVKELLEILQVLERVRKDGVILCGDTAIVPAPLTATVSAYVARNRGIAESARNPDSSLARARRSSCNARRRENLRMIRLVVAVLVIYIGAVLAACAYVPGML